MYRLAADVFNDTAMILDCISPALPKAPRVVLLSFSSVLRALCGVAAGSSKASLSAHFAKCENLGELNAKDSSQETIISLLGMLAGSIVVSQISSTFAVWSWLIALLSIHLATNHAAVQAVNLRTFNRQRANIVFSNYLDQGQILTPKQAADRESIFEWDGIMRWKGSSNLGKAKIGISLEQLLHAVGQSDKTTGSVRNPSVSLEQLLQLYDQENYIMWFDGRRRTAYIVLKEQVSSNDQLKAWAHALWIAHRLSSRNLTGTEATAAIVLQLLAESLTKPGDFMDRWDDIGPVLLKGGWDTGTANLETTSSFRVRVRAAKLS
ncbi:hypothetical protein MMC09_005844 [Bachmanniomyces sp. S44760]|nr:hypothetical protein [Bachmanniomyces sp. S44760]